MANDYDNNERFLNEGLPYVGSDNVDYAKEFQAPMLPESEEEKRARLQAELDQLRELKRNEEAGNISQTQQDLKQQQEIEKIKQEEIKLQELKNKTLEKKNKLDDPLSNAREDGKTDIPKNLQDGPTNLPVESDIQLPIRGPFNKPEPKASPLAPIKQPLVNAPKIDEQFESNQRADEMVDLGKDEPLSPREKLLKEFQALKERRDKGLNIANWADFGTDIAQALAQYGSDMGAVKAGMIGATPIQAKKLQFKKYDNYGKALAEYDSEIGRLEKQSAVLDKQEQLALARQDKKELALIKAKKDENELLRNIEKDKMTKKVQQSQIDKNQSLIDKNKGLLSGTSKEQQDINSKESKAIQDIVIAKLKASGANVTNEVIENMRKIPYSQLADPKQQRDILKKAESKLSIDKEDRLREKHAWQIGEKDELSDKQVESITAIEDTQNLLKRIRELKSKVDTGAYQELAYNAGKWGLTNRDNDRVSLTGLVGTNLANYIKSMSGTAVSDKERAVLLNNIPNMGLDDKEFMAQLKEFEKTIDMTLKTRLKNIDKWQGKNVAEKFKPWVADRFERYGLLQKNQNVKQDEIKKGEVKPEQNKSKAPYGDIFTQPDTGKTYKWNATKGKYQIFS